MKFTNRADINMTGLRGYVEITFGELVEIFGKPDLGPNADLDKTTCEWRLKFEDDTVASIYDYKTPFTPMGVHEWHIGGHDNRALEHVMDTINFHRDQLVQFIRKGIN
jgi:hypothetical protein